MNVSEKVKVTEKIQVREKVKVFKSRSIMAPLALVGKSVAVEARSNE